MMKPIRTIVWVLMVLILVGGMCGVSNAQVGNQWASIAPDASIVKYDNAKVVQPGDDLIAAYDWLKSSDLDGQMGALSRENRRCLILAPGQYALSAMWTIDTRYVDITALSGNNRDTIVYRDGIIANQSVVNITAGIFDMSNFTISGYLGKGDTLGGRGVLYSAGKYGTAGTTAHTTIYCTLTATGAGIGIIADDFNYVSVYVYKTGGAVGPYIQRAGYFPGFSGDNVVFFVGNPGQSTGDVTWAIMWHPVFRNMYFEGGGNALGTSSFIAEDVLGGEFRNCEGRDGAFTIQEDAGIVCATRCYNCKAQLRSFGGDNQAGAWDMSTYINCHALKESFAGCAGWGMNFGGYAQDCTGGAGSFSMSRNFAGTAINCHVGGGGFGGWSEGDEYGTFSGLAINCTAGIHSFGQGHANCVMSGTAINCTKRAAGLYTDDFESVNKGILTDSLAGVATGQVSNFTGTVMNPVSSKPIARTAATTVYPWDNGATFSNLGASGAVEFTLPAAIAGRYYTFIRAEAADTKDVLLTPAGSDTIDGGADLDNTADEIAKCKLECLVTGNWVSTSTGTWN